MFDALETELSSDITEDVIARSPEMKKVVNLAVRISKVGSTVLLQGQSGGRKRGAEQADSKQQ